MTEELKSIKERCESRHLSVKPITLDLEDPGNPGLLTKVEGLVVQIPQERDHKNLLFLDDHELHEVINSEFEKYRFIRGFEAIWSEELQAIECEIQSGDPLRISSVFFRRLGAVLGGSKQSEPVSNFELPSPHPQVKIVIGEASLDFTTLISFKRDAFYTNLGRLAKRPTMRITGLKVHTHDEALRELQRIGNSILFQIDLATNMPIHFALDRDLMRDLRAGRKRMLSKGITLTAPRYQYDEEPLSLYWYARTAQNLPLLQFLAFYQVLEFYFPIYSQADAQRRIRNVLKNPTFDPNSDSDISQILNAVKLSAKGRAFGDERSQLKSTIIACVENDVLWDFFESNQERKDFFDVQKKSRSLAKQKISFSNRDSDLRTEVSNRIYELRCRIVHTKEEDDFEILLPFSPEVGYIKHDLELIELLARNVLIAGGKPLQISV